MKSLPCLNGESKLGQKGPVADLHWDGGNVCWPAGKRTEGLFLGDGQD